MTAYRRSRSERCVASLSSLRDCPGTLLTTARSMTSRRSAVSADTELKIELVIVCAYCRLSIAGARAPSAASTAGWFRSTEINRAIERARGSADTPDAAPVIWRIWLPCTSIVQRESAIAGSTPICATPLLKRTGSRAVAYCNPSTARCSSWLRGRYRAAQRSVSQLIRGGQRSDATMQTRCQNILDTRQRHKPGTQCRCVCHYHCD